MEVAAKVNLIYKGAIYKRGERFECDEELAATMKLRGLIKSEEVELPSLDEELKRRKSGK